MKRVTFLFTMVAVVLGFSSALVRAVNITFTSSDTITSNNVWDQVRIENNGTVVNMLGGRITSLEMFNASTFNMTEGKIEGSIRTSSASTFNLSGGTIEATGFQFDGNVNISGGNITGSGKFANFPS